MFFTLLLHIVQKVLKAKDKLYYDNWHTEDRFDYVGCKGMT